MGNPAYGKGYYDGAAKGLGRGRVQGLGVGAAIAVAVFAWDNRAKLTELVRSKRAATPRDEETEAGGDHTAS